VIRLPERVAIEKALVEGVGDEAIRDALVEAAAASNVPPPRGLGEAQGVDLRRKAIEYLKSSGGLHVPFLDALAYEDLPPLACRLLETAVSAAVERRQGHFQL
ncbi:MAG: hypothetical protein AB7N70_25955, partial [Dehalococcoidia bacterium]